jgi:oligopeptide transport system substrate-binding protein
LDNDPPSLDPALSSGLIDSLILSMFEALTSLQPATGTPMAALSTHYEATPDGLRYTFYLRGHRRPRGTRLPKTEDLPPEFSRGRSAPPDSVPAHWSDNALITAHDFVYSWRRVLDPRTAAEFAFLLHPLRNAQSISAGKLPPDRLGVRAIDDYTLDVELDYSAPYFLELVSSRVFAAVPRQIVETAGARWTDPGLMISSGAFKLS